MHTSFLHVQVVINILFSSFRQREKQQSKCVINSSNVKESQGFMRMDSVRRRSSSFLSGFSSFISVDLCSRMSSLLIPLLILQLVQLSSSLQCHSNHDYTEGGIHITMTKSHCYATSYCAFVHFEDTKKSTFKQGFAQGCDSNNLECGTIDSTPGWTDSEDGRKCKNIKDFGNRGYVCCCSSDNCNTPTSNPNPRIDRPGRSPRGQFPYMLGFLTLVVIITVIIVVLAVILSRKPVKQ